MYNSTGYSTDNNGSPWVVCITSGGVYGISVKNSDFETCIFVTLKKERHMMLEKVPDGFEPEPLYYKAHNHTTTTA